ncbi:DUF1015 domain-containing protein [Desulfurivibrio dismutans]|uniref:DUF1015 domain-containing protein n=1 Tax=Desulfurivibrio dismutans TaxID=1398908 RepID=UPI0023D99769|nr:DUF1015 domain-containing protein [Desulfurivibrio alkaliphilus]MDF1615510.1 DUF1015 domain-containing protein [Desulfurivibrio alkaliphilus]
MAVIVPFRAVRYNPEKISNIEEVVSPPYDVIDAGGQAALLERNPYNMIRLDLSKNVKGEGMTEQRYAGAAELFRQWQRQAVLLREERPAFYIYEVDYRRPDGRTLTRRGFLSRVQLAEFAEGVVKPHEKTFAGVTSDRLRLLDTCQAQFSPIFSLYSDPAGEIMQLLARGSTEPPLYSVPDHNGCEHRLRLVTDPAVLQAVGEKFQDKALYIADGHHRYTTALQYRALVRERRGQLDPADAANHTMMYLCGMEDPGLSVLPTHRLLRLPGYKTSTDLLNALQDYFEVMEISNGGRESLLDETLARMAEGEGGNTCFGFYHPGEDRSFLLTLKDGVMDREAAHQPPALRDLDVVVLSDLIIDRLPDLDKSRCVQGELIDYYSNAAEALDVAVKEAVLAAEAGGRTEATPVLFLMNPTKVDQVRRVADENLVMPHKSTFFYPKVLTGLAINPLSD